MEVSPSLLRIGSITPIYRSPTTDNRPHPSPRPIARLRFAPYLTRLVDHFAAFCAGEEQPLTSAEAGARIVGVLEAASQSMANGGAKVSLDGLVRPQPREDYRGCCSGR